MITKGQTLFIVGTVDEKSVVNIVREFKVTDVLLRQTITYLDNNVVVDTQEANIFRLDGLPGDFMCDDARIGLHWFTDYIEALAQCKKINQQNLEYFERISQNGLDRIAELKAAIAA